MLKMSVKELDELLEALVILFGVCETEQDLKDILLVIDPEFGDKLCQCMMKEIYKQGLDYSTFREHYIEDRSKATAIVSTWINEFVDKGRIELTE